MVFICTIAITHYDNLLYYQSERIPNTNYRWRIYLGWKIHNVQGIHRAMLALRMWFCKIN